MKRWLMLMVLSACVMALPWSVAAVRRQWPRTAALFAVWAAAYACAFTLWFGVGVAVIGLLGVVVTLTTWVRLPD
jgi:hypothetical protein